MHVTFDLLVRVPRGLHGSRGRNDHILQVLRMLAVSRLLREVVLKECTELACAVDVRLRISHLQVEDAGHLVTKQLVHSAGRELFVEAIAMHVSLRNNLRLVCVVTLDFNLLLLSLLNSTVKAAQRVLHLTLDHYMLRVTVLIGQVLARLLL